jgi:hypothetical protein
MVNACWTVATPVCQDHHCPDAGLKEGDACRAPSSSITMLPGATCIQDGIE